jgi:hypothetical protein
MRYAQSGSEGGAKSTFVPARILATSGHRLEMHVQLIFLAIRKMRVIEALRKRKTGEGWAYSLSWKRTNDELQLQSDLVLR